MLAVTTPMIEKTFDEVTPLTTPTPPQQSERQRKPSVSLATRPVQLNISGTKYLVPSNILSRHPTTLLGQLALSTHKDVIRKGLADAFLPQTNEYFYARPPSSFEMILSLYMDNKIHKPGYLCNGEFVKQLDYWQIPTSAEFLCPGCCKGIIFKQASPHSMTTSSPSSLESGRLSRKSFSYENIKQTIWVWVDQTNNKPGYVFTSITLVILLLNFVLMVLDSMPSFEYSDDCAIYFGIMGNDNYTLLGMRGYRSEFIDLCIVNLLITIWFTFEYVIRLWATPSRLLFMKTLMNWCDLISFLPFYVEMAVKGTTAVNFNSNAFRLPKFFRLIKIIRIFRLAKIIKHSKQMRVMSAGIMASRDSFILLVLLLCFFVFGFSSTLYYVEGDEEGSPFRTIPRAAWWSIATYFAYGDCPPVTGLGKVVATLGAVSGIVVLAFPIGLILDSFTATFKAQRENSHSLSV